MLCERSKELVAKFKELKKDGWTITEIMIYIKICLCALVLVASKIEGLDGERKAEWVSDEFRSLYWEINPDIPKVPNWIEAIAEKIVIDFITPGLVKLAYNSVFGKKSKIEEIVLE